jgi:hypothetical protein
MDHRDRPKNVRRVNLWLAPAARTAYVQPVRSFSKTLIYVLIAAQLLLALPAMASAQTGASAAHEMPCDEMPMPAGDDPCPCCPDGANSMTDCLVACTLAATAAPSLSSGQAAFAAAPPIVEIFHSFDAPADPPLNPPPIA